jgi:hypothetical protein
MRNFFGSWFALLLACSAARAEPPALLAPGDAAHATIEQASTTSIAL